MNNLNMTYVNALARAVTLCETLGIEISEADTHMGGFRICFEGLDGDAIIHDFSYGHEEGLWETMGFPWDNDDVSVHTTEQLIYMVDALLNDEPWEEYEGI